MKRGNRITEFIKINFNNVQIIIKFNIIQMKPKEILVMSLNKLQNAEDNFQ